MGVLVTGGAGYIGSHVLLELQAIGEPIVVLDDFSTGFRENIPAGVRLIEGSAGDAALLDRIFADGGIDTVIHLAAALIVPESVREPEKYYRNNTFNACTLFSACAKAGVKNIVFSSTAAVYGDTGKGQVSEADTPAPVSPYGRSKLATEWILEDMAAALDLNFVALRYFNVAGADPLGRTGQRSPNATHLIQVACEAALGKRSALHVFGTDYPTKDGAGVRDYIHVSDLAKAHIAALKGLRTGAVKRERLNCGYGRGYSVFDVIGAVERATGRTVPVVIAPRRPGDLAEVVADCARIRAMLDWTPERADIDLIVRDTVRWYEGRLNAVASR
ncbi:MAG: UDP-glucose 4-epimerase GalE [Hyphomonadaceae bacterium]|nr:UDP-glucose 4-epimerase GalE [Hyphomonadaceae bacterium]